MRMKFFLFFLLTSFTFSALSLFAAQTVDSLYKQPTSKDKNKSDTFFYVDVLLWHAEESGMDYAVDKGLMLATYSGTQGDTRRAQFEWDPAFRVALGHRFSRDQWQLKGEYGVIFPKDCQVVHRHHGAQLQGTFPKIFDGEIETATSDVYLRAHFANFLLARDFHISKKILLQFFHGMTGSWFKQNWEVAYNEEETGVQTHIKPKWRFKGAGLKAGFLTDWDLGAGFNWSSLLALGLIYGNYDNRIRTFTIQPNGNQMQYQNNHVDEFRVVTHLNFFMGPSFEKVFCQYDLYLFLGYELNTWFNLHQVDREEFHTPPNRTPNSRFFPGTLQMHGVTLRVKITF